MTSRDPELLIEVDDAQALQTRLAELTKLVPLRTEGRTNDDTERYSLVKVLTSIAAELSFPLSVIHRDRPDFHLKQPDLLVGLEMVEVISERQAAEDAMRERGVGPDMHMPRSYRPGERPPKASKLRAEIERDEMGDGWVGDSVENEWGDAMAWSINKKLGVAGKEGFELFPENWLVLYDNWSLPKANFKLHKAIAHLATRADLTSVFAKFSRVLIVSDSKVIDLESSGEWRLRGQGDPS